MSGLSRHRVEDITSFNPIYESDDETGCAGATVLMRASNRCVYKIFPAFRLCIIRSSTGLPTRGYSSQRPHQNPFPVTLNSGESHEPASVELSVNSG